MKKKEKKEKKEKKAKKAKKAPQQGGKKRMSKKKLILLALVMIAIVAAALIFLRGKGDDAEGEEIVEEEVVKEDPVVSAPIAYALDEGLEIMALPVGKSVVVKAHTEEVPLIPPVEEQPEDEPTVEQLGADLDSAETEEGEEPEEEETPVEEEPETVVRTTYIYTGEGADAKRMKLYCELLMADDFGFIPIDEQMIQTKKPDFTQLSGSVHLVRAVAGSDYVEEVNLAEKGEDKRMENVPQESKELEGEYLMSLRIEWNEEELRVTPAMIEGAIYIPPPPEPMTLVEAVEHMYAMDPALLGLEGESMEPYMVFPIDGSVMVDGAPAMRMYVYSKSPGGTNVFEGQYLLSNGGHRIFAVQSDGSLREVEQ